MIRTIAAISIALLGTTFSPTPQGAALSVLSFQNSHVIVVRTNVAGRFATVMTSGVIKDSLPVAAPLTAPLLVERFSFGWQALDSTFNRCSFAMRGFSFKLVDRLMQGMPAPKIFLSFCRGLYNDAGNDAGPIAQVEAVRQRMGNRALIPWVVVSSNFALGQWYGGGADDGGGQKLFKKAGNGWRIVASGGDAMGVREMRKYGVPRSAWCAFGISDGSGRCSRSFRNTPRVRDE